MVLSAVNWVAQCFSTMHWRSKSSKLSFLTICGHAHKNSKFSGLRRNRGGFIKSNSTRLKLTWWSPFGLVQCDPSSVYCSIYNCFSLISNRILGRKKKKKGMRKQLLKIRISAILKKFSSWAPFTEGKERFDHEKSLSLSHTNTLIKLQAAGLGVKWQKRSNHTT